MCLNFKVFDLPLISDATSKEGINLEIDESTSQNIEHPVQSETEDPKIIIRKDKYILALSTCILLLNLFIY